jgi:hypothetical protein
MHMAERVTDQPLIIVTVRPRRFRHARDEAQTVVFAAGSRG